MIVAVALMAMGCAVLVAMVVMGVIMVRVIMPAATGVAMGVRMRVSVGMSVRLGLVSMTMRAMVMVIMVVSVMVVVVVMMRVMAVGVAGVVAIGVVVVVGATLGLERAHHRTHCAALAAHHFGQNMVVLDIDRVGGNLGRRVPVADMPGDAHQPQRVLRADFEQALRRRLHQHEPAILELDGIAVPQRGGLIEIEQDIEPTIGLEREAAAVAVVMVERQRVDDAILPDGGLANNGGGAKHGETVRDRSKSEAVDRPRLDHFDHRRRHDASPRLPQEGSHVLRAHVAVNVGTGLPALEGDETAGLSQAFMEFIAQAAGFLAGGLNAGRGGVDE